VTHGQGREGVGARIVGNNDLLHSRVVLVAVTVAFGITPRWNL